MDKLIWQNIANGEKGAYKEVYTGYFKKFFNYGRKFTNNHLLIEDSIQEVFLDVWHKKEKMITVDMPNSYLFSSFRYSLFKKIKQSARLQELNDWDDEPQFSIEQSIITSELNREMQQKLQSALQSLTSRQREAIFLRFYEGLSYEEVAAVLNITVKATYKIMARSIGQLKDQMAGLSPSALIIMACILGAMDL